MHLRPLSETFRQTAALLSQKKDAVLCASDHAQRDIPASLQETRELLRLCRFVLFPFLETRPAEHSVLPDRIALSLGLIYDNLVAQLNGEVCLARRPHFTRPEAEQIAEDFIRVLPQIKSQLIHDGKALLKNDPAAVSLREILLAYPSTIALMHYRIAHALLHLGVPIMPRMISEIAHGLTGIDIHPGAVIGEHFCIDHGTGVVIGQTCVIGRHVMLYQGVTLGTRSYTFDEKGMPQNVPRHPIIEDHVTIYSHATILGRVTIGHHSIIGADVWLAESVAANSKITKIKKSDK